MEATSTVDHVGAFVDALRELGAAGMKKPWWFRGHKNTTYRLQASSLREARFRTNEAAMLKRFMQDASSKLTRAPQNDWDWLFLAQHHGVPTRLLDWSENALVGLYFACESDGDVLEGMPEPDGDVWVLMPETLNHETGVWNASHRQDLPLLGVDELLNRYNPLVASPPQETCRHVAAIASRDFPRIISQWGTFTVTDEESAIEDLPTADKYLKRITVLGAAKQEILEELSSLGIEERVVYPDLHRLGSRVKEMFA